MAKSKQQPDTLDAPAPGCVWMSRTHPETGEQQRAEIDTASGSVEVMAAQGWTED